MVASASDTGSSVGNLKALREIKQAEEEVRQMRADAKNEAQEIVQQARSEAREILNEKKEAAETEAEAIVEEAEAEAKTEAESILATADEEASELRDVPDERIEKAAEAVLDRFRQTVGGA